MNPSTARPKRWSDGLRIIPVERAMDIVARSSPAVEFAGRDRPATSWSSRPSPIRSTQRGWRWSLVRINRARPTRSLRAGRPRRPSGAPARGRQPAGPRAGRWSGQGAPCSELPRPCRQGSLDALPLHRLHPSLPRVPRGSCATWRTATDSASSLPSGRRSGRTSGPTPTLT